MKYTFKSSLYLAALLLVGGAITCTSTAQKTAALPTNQLRLAPSCIALSALHASTVDYGR